MTSVFDFTIVWSRIRAPRSFSDGAGADIVEELLVEACELGSAGAAHDEQGILDVRQGRRKAEVDGGIARSLGAVVGQDAMLTFPEHARTGVLFVSLLKTIPERSPKAERQQPSRQAKGFFGDAGLLHGGTDRPHHACNLIRRLVEAFFMGGN